MKETKEYEVFLHDFGNLECQLILETKDKEVAEVLSDSINFLLARNNHKTIACEFYEKEVKNEIKPKSI